MIDMLGDGYQRVESAMIAREKAQATISSNIANADTPNYHVDQRTFSDFLAERVGNSRTGKPAATHASHIQESSSARLSESIYHHSPSQRMDGNTVDVQKEMARMSENQLMHELSMRLVKGRINGLLNAIKEGNR